MDVELALIRVVGVSHYQAALEGCSEGEPVYFCHEPDNPHDELAISVESCRGQRIGYLPRTCWLRRSIHEQGRGAAATIYSLGHAWNGLLGVRVAVALTDDAARLRSYFGDREPPEAPPGGYRYWLDRDLRPRVIGEQSAAARR